MNGSRASRSARLGLAAASAGTAWVALYAWRGFSQVPGGFINPLLLLAVVVAGTGTAARWWRWPGAVVVAVQVVVSSWFALLLITGALLPTTGALAELRSELSAAFDSAQRYAAPVPESAPPIDPLLILSGLACLLLVDLLACTLNRVPLAGLPLLTIYSIPVSMVGEPISWWVFVATAAGFLVMLFLQEVDQVSRWGRPIATDRETGDPIAFGAGTHVLRSTAGGIGSVATALAVVLPAVIPTAGVQLFDFGPGHGNGNDISIDNPVTDLVRDLKRGEDTPLLQITTTEPNPSYLRILTLTRFSDVEWSPGDRDVPADQTADGPLPAPEGVAADVPRREVAYDVEVYPAFDSRWLPTQFPASRVQAEGDWRYDEKTMDFLAGDDDLSTAGLRYTMGAWDLDLTAARLERAGTSSGKVSEAFTDVPADLPEIVRELAVDATRGAVSRFDKAVALQNWFREDGGFTYSLDTAPGSGYDALVSFLSEGPGGRTGYCEQFASAMAVMARVLGIPSRVAVGFLKPTPAGADTWVYSAHDMHAWPELYFDGAGWVRFEPTPAGRAQDVPGYTAVNTTPGGNESESAPAGGRSSVSERPLRPSEGQATALPVPHERTSTVEQARSYLLPAAAVGVVVLVALLIPSLVRRRRRSSRLARGLPEGVWLELRDTATDLGVPWPEGKSPRATRNVVIDYLGIPLSSTTPDRPAHGARVAPEGVAALDRIVGALERTRYARPGAEPDPTALRADAQVCITSLAGGATRTARRRATWWPRSVVRIPRRSTRTAPATIEARYGGVVDHAS